MKALLLLLIFSLPAYSAEICDAPGTEVPDAISSLAPVVDAVALMWWSVSPSEYEKAACKTHEVPDYDQWLSQQHNGPLQDKDVKGFEFDNQPRNLVKAFKDMVVNLPERTSSCKTVICAVDEIWGPNVGRKMLYIRARHGFNTSQHAYPDTRVLNSSELNDIMITLADLPPENKNIGRGGNQRMALAAEGAVHPVNPNASADAAITFYDKWRSGDPFSKRYGLFHEFGHNISEQMGNLDDSAQWKALTSCQVSRYGNTNNVEDFTESYVMYRFNGRGLLDNCPEKYQFLKEKAFSGREYLDESQCN